MTLAASAGCNSALFQTAKIGQGPSGVVGITKVAENGNAKVSEYSAFAKVDAGRGASPDRLGYSIGVTAIVPLRDSYHRSDDGGDGFDLGAYPNEWPGVFPEVKIQAPRRWPVDVAADIRLMAFVPERASLILSADLGRVLTPYAAAAYLVEIEGGIATVGSEVNLTRDISLFVECSRWLADHNYPDEPQHLGPKRPCSVGLAFSYHPRRALYQRAAH
jgi:hypothetical protein